MALIYGYILVDNGDTIEYQGVKYYDTENNTFNVHEFQKIPNGHEPNQLNTEEVVNYIGVSVQVAQANNQDYINQKRIRYTDEELKNFLDIMADGGESPNTYTTFFVTKNTAYLLEKDGFTCSFSKTELQRLKSDFGSLERKGTFSKDKKSPTCYDFIALSLYNLKSTLFGSKTSTPRIEGDNSNDARARLVNNPYKT